MVCVRLIVFTIFAPGFANFCFPYIFIMFCTYNRHARVVVKSGKVPFIHSAVLESSAKVMLNLEIGLAVCIVVYFYINLRSHTEPKKCSKSTKRNVPTSFNRFLKYIWPQLHCVISSVSVLKLSALLL